MLNQSYRKPAAPQRYGALNMTAALGPFIMRHPEVKGNMEQFLLQHVLPEFAAPEPYMRAVVRLAHESQICQRDTQITH